MVILVVVGWLEVLCVVIYIFVWLKKREKKWVSCEFSVFGKYEILRYEVYGEKVDRYKERWELLGLFRKL